MDIRIIVLVSGSMELSFIDRNPNKRQKRRSIP